MINVQLYLMIGIPSVLILVGMFANNIQFKKIETQLLRIHADLQQFYHLSRCNRR